MRSQGEQVTKVTSSFGLFHWHWKLAVACFVLGFGAAIWLVHYFRTPTTHEPSDMRLKLWMWQRNPIPTMMIFRRPRATVAPGCLAATCDMSLVVSEGQKDIHRRPDVFEVTQDTSFCFVDRD